LDTQELNKKKKMNKYFECKVSFEKLVENGTSKKVTESHLVDALSFTEAEARITEAMKSYISGEFSVSGIRRMRLAEIFTNEVGDRFYRIKVNFITLDEKSGSEKRTSVQMLAQANSVTGAISVLEEGMKGTISDYTIVSVIETKLMDIIK